MSGPRKSRWPGFILCVITNITHRDRRRRISFRSTDCPSNRSLSSTLLGRSRSLLSRIFRALLDYYPIIRSSSCWLLGVLWDCFNNDGIVVSRCSCMSGLSRIFCAFLDNDPVVGSSWMCGWLSCISVQRVLNDTFFINSRSRIQELPGIISRFFYENSVVRAGPRAIVEGGAESSNLI